MEDAPAQLPVLSLSATALQALKVERKGGQRRADDIDFPLPAHGHVEVAAPAEARGQVLFISTTSHYLRLILSPDY